MLDLKTIINSAGILLTIAGVYVVYKNSPINEWLIDGGDFSTTNFDDIKKKTERKNCLIVVGVYTVIGGSLLQLASNFIPSETP